MTVPLYQKTVPLIELNQIQSKWCDTKCISSETHNWSMYTIWEIETQNLWLTQKPSQGEMADRNIFVSLSIYRLLWNNLWSVSRYVMGPLSGRWRQSGNDQQCLAAPIWKYRSGFGDHRFTFFIDLRPNYTFYTNLTNIVHWVVAYRDGAHLVRLNLEKSWEKSGKSFDAVSMSIESRHKTFLWMKCILKPS